MQILRALVLILLFGCLAEQKLFRKFYKKQDLITAEQSLFLTKFDFGKEGGLISIVAMQDIKIIIIIKDTDIQKHTQNPCPSQSSQKRPQIIADIKPQQTARHIAYKIDPQDHEHIIYLYLENCNKALESFPLTGQEELTFEITLTNGLNGNHFGEDENFLWEYVFLVIAWLGIIIYFFKEIGNVLIHNQDMAKLTSFAGLIIIGIAYFYRLLHLIIYNSNGEGLYFFQYLYHIMKTGCEFVIVTYICAIGWGWSITHLKHDESYLLAGVSVALINIIGLCVSVSADQMAEIHHKYDSTAGYILQILRAVVVVIFFIGILRTLSLSVGKSRRFLKKFSLIGGAYLSSWPLIVVLSEFFLPNYMHNEVITFGQEVTHMLASGFLCKILSNPESTYRKVSMKIQDNPLKMENYKHK